MQNLYRATMGNETATGTEIDRDALREKYREEREKRLRPDGNSRHRLRPGKQQRHVRRLARHRDDATRMFTMCVSILAGYRTCAGRRRRRRRNRR